MLRASLMLAACGFGTTLATPAKPAKYKSGNTPANCTFSGANGAAQVASSKGNCGTIVLNNIVVPAGKSLDLTDLNDNTHVIFQGTTTFGYQEWEGPLIELSGNKITVTGASGSVLDGNGARWWDGGGTNDGKDKPKFFAAHGLTSSSISGLTLNNTPVQGFSISGVQDLTLDHITVDDTATNHRGRHNTDAFDVGDSNGVTISNAVVHNQDDCLAINSGTNIVFTGGLCTGGHGLSIGSVGGRSNNKVSGVHISNTVVKDSQNGVRIKAIAGATGSVTDVTYQDITLEGITEYGVVIEQDYTNGDPTGKPTDGVPITGLTLNNVHGTVGGDGTNVEIICASGACSGWKWDKVAVTGGGGSAKCMNAPSPAKC